MAGSKLAGRVPICMIELLAGTGIILPVEPDGRRHTYHLYVVRVSDRDVVQARLKEAGIETGIHYPTALPFLEPFARRGYSPDDFAGRA